MHAPQINVSQLWSLVPKSQLESIVEDKSKSPVIDCRSFGYHIVRGGGKISFERPLVVLARYFSPQAIRKIEDVGGRCVISP